MNVRPLLALLRTTSLHTGVRTRLAIRHVIRPPINLCASLSLGLCSTSVLAQGDTSAFEGIWSGWLTTQDDPAWQVADYLCFVGCPKAAYEHLSQLLADPANDKRALDALSADTRTYITDWLRAHSTPEGLALMESNTEAGETNGECQPLDFVRAATNPLPLRITRDGTTLIFTYEENSRTRTVFLGDRSFPDPLERSSLGYSIGHIDDDGALVIETRGLVASTYPPITINAAGGHSDQLHGIERYTVTSGDTPMLTLELTLEDPATLTASYVYSKRWIATPDVVLRSEGCVPAVL